MRRRVLAKLARASALTGCGTVTFWVRSSQLCNATIRDVMCGLWQLSAPHSVADANHPSTCMAASSRERPLHVAFVQSTETDRAVNLAKSGQPFVMRLGIESLPSSIADLSSLNPSHLGRTSLMHSFDGVFGHYLPSEWAVDVDDHAGPSRLRWKSAHLERPALMIYSPLHLCYPSEVGFREV